MAIRNGTRGSIVRQGTGAWRRGLLAAAVLSGAASLATAEVKLPRVFGEGMVLQRDQAVPVWGSADKGEKVTVSFAGQEKSVTAGADGAWSVKLDALSAAAAGRPLTVSGSATANPLVLNNVLVGEVWLCSGQSNMEMGIKACNDADKEIAAADYPAIRLFMVPKKYSAAPLNDVEGATWKVCSPTTIAEGGWGGFSAAAYYFGRELHQKLQVPVGLIASSWGGTRIEPWTPPVGFAGKPALARINELVQLRDPGSQLHKDRLQQLLTATEAWAKDAREALAKEIAVPAMPTLPSEFVPLPPGGAQQEPTVLYNAMLHGLVPFAMRGSIWYQGESNHGEGMLYVEKTKALVEGWRQVFQNPSLPYYYVQIAPYQYGSEAPTVLPEFWEAQAAIEKTIPNTGMIVIHDVGNLNDIHPKNKQEVGRRLALLALAKTYGQKNLVCAGPAFKALALEGAKARVTFDNVGGGLVARDGKPLTHFELIDGEQGGFVPAKAEIDGASVVLTAEGVTKPVALRFAWHKLAEPNLANKEGLPALPFRAGDVPKRDYVTMNVPEAKDYQLVYSLDLTQLSGNIGYAVDNRAKLAGKAFDRIAYCVELQPRGADAQAIYVSMDAFTDDLGKIGVPTAASKAKFQQKVGSLNVYSNVKGIALGVGLKGGNLEFWPHNYAQGNAIGIPGAQGNKYDFGDQATEPEDGYGSMQVHNFEAKQTLFAINNWKGGKGGELGIGNGPADNPDWTFSRNAGNYESGQLRVFVRLK